MSSTPESPRPQSVSLIGAAVAIVGVIGANPGIVPVWVLFSLIMGLIRSFTVLFMAAGSQTKYDTMSNWSPLVDLTGAGLPSAARVALPFLMLLSIAFYQATLNRAVMPRARPGGSLSELCILELKQFASVGLAYGAIVSISVVAGLLFEIGWKAARIPSMSGFTEVVCAALSLLLLARLALVSPAAYAAGSLGFAASWRLTARRVRVILLILVICGVVAEVQTLLVSAAHYQVLDLLNGGHPGSPAQTDLGSFSTFVLSDSLMWSLVQSIFGVLFWPIILAPLPVIYLRLAGEPGAVVSRGRSSPPAPRKSPGKLGIGLPIALALVAVAVGSLAYGWWQRQGDVSANFSNAFACTDLGQSERAAKAIAACNSALKSGKPDVTRAQLLRFRGEDYRDLGDFAHALADLTTADKLQPNEFHTLEDLGDVHEASGDYPAAIGDYQRLFHVLPADVGVFISRCSDKAEEGKGLDQARTDCDAVLKFKPGDPYVLQARGILGLRRSRFGEALADFNDAAIAQPGDAGHLYGRGLAEIGLGRTPEGKADLATATRVDIKIAGMFADYGLGPTQRPR